MIYPSKILHFINNIETEPSDKNFFEKKNPVTGLKIADVARGNKADVEKAVRLAAEKAESWALTPVTARADILRKATLIMQERKEAIASIVAQETGKSFRDALGETTAAIEMGFFIAGEGRRFYGKTTTSAIPDRTAMTVRKPVGVSALIISFNTPIANVAWKAFPALLCGNTAIMKPSEDTPFTALYFAELLRESGLPAGVFSVVQGFGNEAGRYLTGDERVELVSFTGSVEAGKTINKTVSERLAKVCLELGGKNALVVCDDADLDIAVESAVLSAFSNAGQRCASGSRIIVFDSVYEKFKAMLLKKTASLKIGNADTDDLGPVINEKQLDKILRSIQETVDGGRGRLLCGGKKLPGDGYFLEPTIFEEISTDAKISDCELFGPVTILYRVNDFNEAVKLVNNSSYGLTAAIHTAGIHRIQEFQKRVKTGVISINGHTYGSEPHLPFGGYKNSGNGFREAGTEVLDVYSEWQTVYTRHFPGMV